MNQPQWITTLQNATDAYVADILGGIPPAEACGHRYCNDLGYGLCMGVAGAQIDMLEDSGRTRREAVGKVIADIWS